MVDPLRLSALLDRIGAETAALRRLARRTVDDLLADPDVLAGVKYRFVVAIEACIDAGRHLAASEGMRVPRDYADVFTVLGEHGLIEPGLVTDMRDTARFRNLLVHGYASVDDRRVVEILHSRVGDLDLYRQKIARVVADRPSGAGT